jgi:Putative Ig domain
MPTIPCPTKFNCACPDSPLTGVCIEAGDEEYFLGQGFAALVPPLGNTSWTTTQAYAPWINLESQQAADLMAAVVASEILSGAPTPAPIWPPGTCPSAPPPGPAPGLFYNAPQSCTVNCPDGLPFTYQVPAGSFTGSSQTAADQAAVTYACAQAAAQVICLGSLTPNVAPVGQAYTGTITATGQPLLTGGVNWSIIAGSLPPGCGFSGSGTTGTITGTPSVQGTYNFTVQIADSIGGTMQKPFTLAIECSKSATVTQPNLPWTAFPPDAGYDTAYASHLTTPPGAGQFIITFTSFNTLTWNWLVRAKDVCTVTINGVSQTGTGSNPEIFGGTPATAFVTSACTPVVLIVAAPPNGFNEENYFVEWATPAGF